MDVAAEEQLLWEGFMHVSTPAFLFKAALNTQPASPPRAETLSTGRYTLQVGPLCRPRQQALLSLHARWLPCWVEGRQGWQPTSGQAMRGWAEAGAEAGAAGWGWGRG